MKTGETSEQGGGGKHHGFSRVGSPLAGHLSRVTSRGLVWARVVVVVIVAPTPGLLLLVVRTDLLINSHNQIRGHKTGLSHSGVDVYPTQKIKRNQMWYTHMS